MSKTASQKRRAEEREAASFIDPKGAVPKKSLSALAVFQAWFLFAIDRQGGISREVLIRSRADALAIWPLVGPSIAQIEDLRARLATFSPQSVEGSAGEAEEVRIRQPLLVVETTLWSDDGEWLFALFLAAAYQQWLRRIRVKVYRRWSVFAPPERTAHYGWYGYSPSDARIVSRTEYPSRDPQQP